MKIGIVGKDTKAFVSMFDSKMIKSTIEVNNKVRNNDRKHKE